MLISIKNNLVSEKSGQIGYFINKIKYVRKDSRLLRERERVNGVNIKLGSWVIESACIIQSVAESHNSFQHECHPVLFTFDTGPSPIVKEWSIKGRKYLISHKKIN